MEEEIDDITLLFAAICKLIDKVTLLEIRSKSQEIAISLLSNKSKKTKK